MMTNKKNPELTTYEGFFYHHRPRLTGLAALAVIVLAAPTLDSLIYGTLVVLLGEFGRTWALGYIDKDAELATAGPYAFTRNPLYVSNLTMFLGFCIMGNTFTPALIGMLVFFWIYMVVIKIEASRMVFLFGEAYVTWATYVPLFIPRLTPWQDRVHKKHSMALVYSHDEPKHWWGVLAGLSIFYIIFYIQNS